MGCKCAKLPDAFFYEAAPEFFLEDLEELAIGSWVKLFKCKLCAQNWSIDEWDKYQERTILKVSEVANWQEIDSTPLRKSLLLEYRGGTIDENCIWAGCNGKQVKGVVLCINHLYATGARK